MKTLGTHNVNSTGSNKAITANAYHAHTCTSVVTSPTCTEYGYTTHTCDCGYCYHSNAVAALGHDLQSINTNDVQIYECSRCGYHYIDHTHRYFATPIKPTCTTDGYTLSECGCGYCYESDPIAALGHLYDSLKDMVCNRCGYNRGGTVVTPLFNP